MVGECTNVFNPAALHEYEGPGNIKHQMTGDYLVVYDGDQPRAFGMYLHESGRELPFATDICELEAQVASVNDMPIYVDYDHLERSAEMLRPEHGERWHDIFEFALEERNPGSDYEFIPGQGVDVVSP